MIASRPLVRKGGARYEDTQGGGGGGRRGSVRRNRGRDGGEPREGSGGGGGRRKGGRGGRGDRRKGGGRGGGGKEKTKSMTVEELDQQMDSYFKRDVSGEAVAVAPNLVADLLLRAARSTAAV